MQTDRVFSNMQFSGNDTECFIVIMINLNIPFDLQILFVVVKKISMVESSCFRNFLVFTFFILVSDFPPNLNNEICTTV